MRSLQSFDVLALEEAYRALFQVYILSELL